MALASLASRRPAGGRPSGHRCATAGPLLRHPWSTDIVAICGRRIRTAVITLGRMARSTGRRPSHARTDRSDAAAAYRTSGAGRTSPDTALSRQVAGDLCRGQTRDPRAAEATGVSTDSRSRPEFRRVAGTGSDRYGTNWLTRV